MTNPRPLSDKVGPYAFWPIGDSSNPASPPDVDLVWNFAYMYLGKIYVTSSKYTREEFIEFNEKNFKVTEFEPISFTASPRVTQ